MSWPGQDHDAHVHPMQMREGKAGQSQPGSSSMQPASAPDIPGKNSRSMGAAAVAELSPSGPDESRLTDAIAVDPKQDHEQEEEDAQQAYYTYYSTMGSEHPAVQPPSADTAAAADSAGSAAVPSAGAVADRTSSHALDDLHLGEDASSVGTAGEFGLRDEAQQTDDSDEVEEIILRGHAPTGAGSLAAVQTGMTAVQYSAVQSFAYSGEAGTSSAGGMVEVAVPACARLVSGALVGGKYASTGGEGSSSNQSYG